MSDSRLIDQDRELQSTREDVRDIFNARVIQVLDGEIKVVSDYLDGGVNEYPAIGVDADFVIGDEVLIARDEHDAWKVVKGGTPRPGPTGPTGPAGSVGATGPAGPPGVDSTYHHSQAIASSVWTVIHNLGKYPDVQTFNSAGDQMSGAVHHDSTNQLTITFSASTGGDAYCN